MQTAKQPLSQEYALSPAASRNNGKQPQTGKQPASKHRALSSVFAAAMLAALVFTAPAAAKDEKVNARLMDKNKILKAYGCEKNGNYYTDLYASYITLDLSDTDHAFYGTIEHESDRYGYEPDTSDGFIDTIEEVITATYFCPVKITKKAQAVVDKELPKGKEGALRLCSMWLLKTAEYPENATAYTNAIAIVKEKAQEKYGVTLTDGEIRDYYAESMKKKVYETQIKLLSKDEQDKIRELLLAYLLDPTEQNAQNFRDFKESLTAAYPKKGDAIAAFVKDISSEVRFKLV